MFIDRNSIIIDGVNMGSYLVEVEYQYNKLWASDTGRNLAGEMSGTLVGIFPKFVLQFRQLSKTEFETVAQILDKSNQIFTYYDPYKRQTITIQTYTGDYKITNKNMLNNVDKNEGFSCSFIAISKRV